MNTTLPMYNRRIVRDVLALSVGFGLGVSYALVGGFAPDFADLPAEERRTEISNAVSAATWTDGPWPFTIGRGELMVHRTGGRPGRIHRYRQG